MSERESVCEGAGDTGGCGRRGGPGGADCACTCVSVCARVCAGVCGHDVPCGAHREPERHARRLREAARDVPHRRRSRAAVRHLNGQKKAALSEALSSVRSASRRHAPSQWQNQAQSSPGLRPSSASQPLGAPVVWPWMAEACRAMVSTWCATKRRGTCFDSRLAAACSLLATGPRSTTGRGCDAE